MILKAENKNVATNLVERDLSLIISEFSTTVSKYECESIIPISLWVELEESKNDLLRVINIINDENLDLEEYDNNNDISREIWNNNDSKPYNNSSPSYSPNVDISKNNCNFCNPIKIDFNFKFQKPEIKANLRLAIDVGNMMFQPNAEIVCSTAMIMSQGCIPDLVKIIGTLLMALNTIISSVNLESLSLSSFLSATIGAVLDISIKKGMFMMNVSVSRSECLSQTIKEILSYLPTSESLNERLDPELLKRFGLYNKNPTSFVKMYENLDKNLTQNGSTAIDSIFNNINSVSETVDMALQKVNDWLEGLFAMSNYLPCERERSASKPSELISQVMNIMSMINTIRSIIDKKYQKENCGSSTESGGNITPEEIVEIINDVIEIDKIVRDNSGNTIGIILPRVGLRTSYLDTFGCNVPTFMDRISDGRSNQESTVNANVLDSFNTELGETEKRDNYYGDVFNWKYQGLDPSNSYNAKKPEIISINEVTKNSSDSYFVDVANMSILIDRIITEVKKTSTESESLIIEKVKEEELLKDEISNLTPDNYVNSSDPYSIIAELQKLSSITDLEIEIKEDCK